MAHKNVIIIYKINSTKLVVAGMTKWLWMVVQKWTTQITIVFIPSVQKSHDLY